MIGFEVELDRRVSDPTGAKIEGDVKLATCFGDEFTVVTDARSAKDASGADKAILYSNIELVTRPFEQMTGDVTPIQQAFQHMQALAGCCYKIGAAATVSDVLKMTAGPYWLTTTGGTAVVHPGTELIGPVDGRYYRVLDNGPDKLFVHYTVGFPVLRLAPALDWLTKQVRPQAENGVSTFPITNARRAARAGSAAAELFRRWCEFRKVAYQVADSVALAGFVALVYTQIAAVVDRSYGLEGQVKNKSIVVCRVPLRNVAGVLPPNVQRFLREQAWADMLEENGVRDSADALSTFLAASAKEAVELAEDKKESADGARSELMKLEQLIADADIQIKSVTNELAMLPEHVDPAPLTAKFGAMMAALDGLKAEAGKRKDIIADYTDCATAAQQWSVLQVKPPEDLIQVYKEWLAGQFPWSVITHAIAPALEGRLLANDLPSKGLDNLFAGGPVKEGSAAPDKGKAWELATGTESDMDGDPVTLGQYLYSALLAPAQRTLGPTKIFGGMHEVAHPDVFTGSDSVPRYLVPLELRSHGPQFVTWDQLGKALDELIRFSRDLAA